MDSTKAKMLKCDILFKDYQEIISVEKSKSYYHIYGYIL